MNFLQQCLAQHVYFTPLTTLHLPENLRFSAYTKRLTYHLLQQTTNLNIQGNQIRNECTAMLCTERENQACTGVSNP